MLFDILNQSAVFLPFAFGVYITYGILKRPDLTVDGSFVLGAGVYAKCVLAGVPPLFAMGVATFFGALAGVGTSLIQYRDRISSLIAGILALFILQSLNLIVMQRPNINLLEHTSLIEKTGALLVLNMGLTFFLVLFLSTRVGLLLRAFGSNTQLVSMMGKKAERYRMIGFGLSNALVAFSGCLTAQANGFADIGMGTGLVLIGIGVVILGQQSYRFFFRGRHLSGGVQLLFCAFGVVVYFSVVNTLVSLGMNPVFLKMLIGLALVAFLVLQRQQKGSAVYE
ncbi:MAG: hypothetical protein S4CHLAM123_04750 [Chlamydiales bacterium]|nr:hypothetical protein [Chlamydiales bacterium]